MYNGRIYWEKVPYERIFFSNPVLYRGSDCSVIVNAGGVSRNSCCFIFIFCRSDYLKVGGFNTNITGWGDEDVLLFRKFAQSNLTTYRSPDPDIYHLWHQKKCNPALPDDKYLECIKTKVANEGTQLQLAYMLFKDEMEWRRKARDRLWKSDLIRRQITSIFDCDTFVVIHSSFVSILYKALFSQHLHSIYNAAEKY